MALRHLQLFRNTSTGGTREAAIQAANLQLPNLKDGDVIAARYVSSGVTSVAVGHVVNNVIVWNDPQAIKETVSANTANLEKAVGVAHEATAITFDSNSKYIGTSNSASGAIQSLDTNLYATSGKVDEVRAAIGSSASTLNIENGNYVASSDTVKQAVTKLDANLETVSSKTDNVTTAFNNYTTQVVGAASGSTGLGATGSNITTGDTVKVAIQNLDKAIESGDTATDNLRKAVGATEGASAMTYASTTKYIKNDTTVKAALETLDGSLNTVSGDLDTLESTYASYTAATDNKINTISGKVDNAQGVLGTTEATLNVSGHYVTTTDSVKDAIDKLDDKLYEVGSGATLDLENLRKAVGVQSGDSAITIADAHYATGNNVVTALTQLDTQLYSATTKAENAQAALGSTGTTLGASGQYVSTGQTAKVAVETLDSNLVTVSGKAESALTYVGNIDSVVGVQNSATTFTTTGEIASSTTTVKGAVEALDDAIVDLSGKTASDDDLKALAKAVGVEKGVSSMTFSNTNYLNGQTSASGALVTLDSTVKGVRDDVNTVSGNVNTVSGNVNTLSGEVATYSAATNDKINGLSQALGIVAGTSGMTFSNTNYLDGQTSASGALVTLDTVEKATRDAVGLTGTANTISLSGEYISGATTVKGGLEALDTNLAELSGSVTQNKVSGTNPIVVTTASTGTTVSLKINSAYTDSSVTTAETADMHKNIILTGEDGIYAVADLHYDSATNKLKFVNSNGTRDIQLTGVQVFEECYYDATQEKIILVYTNMSGGTGNTVEIDVKDIIQEYSFQAASGSGVAPTSTEHNVYLYADRSGQPSTNATPVYGEISVFDCGTY